MPLPRLYAAVVDGIITALWLVLLCADAVLVGLRAVPRLVQRTVSGTRPAGNGLHRSRVVIVGGGLAGLKVQRDLASHSDTLDVIVVERKTYFEYVPGVLRCLVKPAHFRHLSCDMPSAPHRLVHGDATAVDTSAHTVSVASGDSGTAVTLPYDYLVLAGGSHYFSPIKPLASQTTRENTAAGRQAALDEAHAVLEAARRVIIIGAGAVGVELAGEIATAYGNRKAVILMDMAPMILPGMHEGVSRYASGWLKRNGVETILGVTMEAIEDRGVVLPGGRRLDADVVYKCMGARPATDWIQKMLPPEAIGHRGAIRVNNHLQVQSVPDNVFCLGDMMLHEESNEIKLGHTAEVNAALVACNILLKEAGQPLLSYPEGVVGAKVTPQIYNISLGPYDAVMHFNGLVVGGLVAVVGKWALEWTKLRATEQRPIGLIVWWLADHGVNFLGRTLLPTPMAPNT